MEAMYGMKVRLAHVRPPARRPWDIGSVPDRAAVYVDGYYVGTTPVEVALRREEHEIVFRKDGFADRTYHVSRVAGSGRRASWSFSAAYR